MKKTTLALVLLLAAGPALAGVIEGRVIEVLDGATLTVLTREGASIHRIRLAGIDAPGKDKAISGSARESLRRMVRGKTVRVETNAIDTRGLLIGNVEIHRTPKDCNNQPCPALDPGLTQLTSGLAVIDKKNLSHQKPAAQKLYMTAQAQAKANRLGVWRDTSMQSAAHNAPPPPPSR
jgi:endonuclease YncB( thermonuclease family)